MLYDRLLVDLAQAERALLDGDTPAARQPLQHAQDILLELLGSLDIAAWDAGPALASLYGFCVSELMAAHLESAAGHVTTCIALLEPLRVAWHGAASSAAAAEELVGSDG
jgi:flagellar protein FliS